MTTVSNSRSVVAALAALTSEPIIIRLSGNSMLSATCPSILSQDRDNGLAFPFVGFGNSAETAILALWIAIVSANKPIRVVEPYCNESRQCLWNGDRFEGYFDPPSGRSA